MTADALRSVAKSNYGKPTGLIRRVVATALAAMADAEEARAELAQHQAELQVLERARPDRERLLVVVEPDGWFEVFGEKWHDVRVVHVPKVSDANRQHCEDLMTEALPMVYRDLWLPGNVIATGTPKLCPSILELKYSTLAMDLMDALESAI
ncbi:MAG: hypothetical protein AAGJ46_12035 [Planctomycetota bacterium]